MMSDIELKRDDAEKRLFKQHGERLTLKRDTYHGVAINATFHCNNHNVDFEAKLYNIERQPLGCPVCVKESKSSINLFDKYEMQVEEHTGGSVVLLKKDFEGARKPAWFNCKEHGEFLSTVKNILRKKVPCPTCAKEGGHLGRSVSAVSMYAKQIDTLFKGIVRILEDTYTKAKELAVFECKEHGKFSSTVSKVLVSKNGCPKCGNQNKAKEQIKPFSEMAKEVKELTKGRYTLLNKDYRGSRSQITVSCSNPSHSPIKIKFSNVGNTIDICPECRKDNAANRVMDYINERVGDHIQLVGKYVAGNIETEFKCTKHDTVFKSKPLRLVAGANPCPDCIEDDKNANKIKRAGARHERDKKTVEKLLEGTDVKVIKVFDSEHGTAMVKIYCPHHGISVRYIWSLLDMRGSACVACNLSSKNGLYLLKSKGDFRYKVGMTQNLDKRILKIMDTDVNSYWISMAFYVPDIKISVPELERRMIKHFKCGNVPGNFSGCKEVFESTKPATKVLEDFTTTLDKLIDELVNETKRHEAT